MVGVSERASHEGLLGTRSRELVLRVCGGPRDGHVVRLASTKCAVGSAENCTLRLRGAGVQPLHCLILRGAQQTVIRSWSRDTRLNGRAFDDALLTPGDRLSVGPLEFDVVETGSETGCVEQVDDRTVVADTLADNAPPAGLLAADAAAAIAESNRAEIARLRAELEAEQSAFEARMHEQIAAFEARRAAWESNCMEWQNRSDASQRERLNTLDAREAELREREEQLSRRLDDVQQNQSHREAVVRQIDEQRCQLDSQLAELAQERTALGRQAEELASQQQLANDFQQRLEQERADLQVRYEELAGQRIAHESLRAELEEQRRQVEGERSAAETARAELARQRDEIETQRTELGAAVARVEEEQRGLEARRADLDRQSHELEQTRRQFFEQQQHERQGESQVEQLRTEYDADKSRLESELALLADRLAAAEQLATTARAEKEAAEQRISAVEQQLADCEPQLAAHRERLAQKDQRLAQYEQETGEQTQRHADMIAQLAERDHRLGEAEAELQGLRAQLAEMTSQANLQLDQQAQSDSIQLALREAAQKIEFEQSALEMSRRQWNEERTAEETRLRDEQERHQMLESRLRDERATLTDLRRELEEERKAIELLRGVLKPEVTPHAEETELTVAQLLCDRQSQADGEHESTIGSGEEVEFSPTKDEAPISTSDLFQRLGISASDDEVDSSAARTASGSGAGERARHVSRPELPPVVPVAAPAATEDREESIEEYMQKLLQRTRRAGDAPLSPANYAPTPVVDEKPPVVAEPTPTAPGSTDPSTIQRPARPRPSAAETAKDLSGLREIANLSARGAIATFDRKKRKNAVIGRSTLALCTLTLGVVLLFMGKQEPILYYSGLAGIVFGIFSTVSATIATVRFRKAKLGQDPVACHDGAEEMPGDAAPEADEAVPAAEPRDAE